MLSPEQLWSLSPTQITALSAAELEESLDFARQFIHDLDHEIENCLADKVQFKQIFDLLILESEERRKIGEALGN